MIDHPPTGGGWVMNQPLAKTRYDDWLVYAALLPALLTLWAIGVTAAMAWHNQAIWHAAATVSVIRGDADDYVQGLAKLGIAKLPGYEPPPAGEFINPVVAGH
jgi:hypothetical protein